MLRTLAASMIAALLSFSAWYWLGRPAALAEPEVSGPVSCVSYTPYRANQSPFDTGPEARIDPARVAEDLQLLSAHTACIRVYASVGMEVIPAVAQQYGMQVLLGAWVGADAKATRAEIEALVQLANAYPATIRAVLVGNEALLRREIAPEALAALVREVKSRVAQPVSYADVWEFHLHYPAVAEASDFVTIHILPYWEDQPMAIDGAIAHVRAIRQRVATRFPGKPLLIGETGWPSVGRMREGALPSRINEARFLRGFVAAARAEGWDYNLIEAFDQPWKRQLEGAVGGYWGIFSTARQDKGLLQGAVSEHPYWLPLGALAALLATVAVLIVRLPLRWSVVVPLAAVGWTLQAEQLWFIVRNSVEWGAALIWLGVTATVCGAVLARLARQPWPVRREALALLGLGSSAAVVSLWLVFDPRYRDFFVAGVVPPVVLSMLAGRLRALVVNAGAEELAVGCVLVVSAVFIAVNESLQNIQALVWVATTLVLGGLLMWRGFAVRNGA